MYHVHKKLNMLSVNIVIILTVSIPTHDLKGITFLIFNFQLKI